MSGKPEIFDAGDAAPMPTDHLAALDKKIDAEVKVFDGEKKPAAVAPEKDQNIKAATKTMSGEPEIFDAGDAAPMPTDHLDIASNAPPSSEPDTLKPPQARPPPPPQSSIEHEFHAVEATLVEDPEEPQTNEPELVYHAEIVAPLPWWKRHMKKMFLVFILIIAALVTFFSVVVAGQNRANSSPAPPLTASSVPSSSHLPSFQPTTFSCVRWKQTLFETDCDDCNPDVQMSGDTAVITKNYESIQFLTKNAEGNFENADIFELELDYFISDIDISDGHVAIGSPEEGDDIESVYVYEEDSFREWSLLQRIKSPLRPGTGFGSSVDVDGNLMAVVAPNSGENGEGSAFVYRRDQNEWVLEEELSPDNSISDEFGGSVSVKGDMFAVGDRNYGDNNGFNNEAAATLYLYNSSVNLWEASEGPSTNGIDCDGEIGTEVVLTEDNGLMIGCGEENFGAGAIFYYEKSDAGGEFIFQQKITASDNARNDNFGWDIGVDGNVMAVGTSISSDGKAYVFRREDKGWVEVAIIYAPQGSPYFGEEVAILGNEVLVASRENVYLYSLDECFNEF
jgi:hypothetical protein